MAATVPAYLRRLRAVLVLHHARGGHVRVRQHHARRVRQAVVQRLQRLHASHANLAEGLGGVGRGWQVLAGVGGRGRS